MLIGFPYKTSLRNISMYCRFDPDSQEIRAISNAVPLKTRIKTLAPSSLLSLNLIFKTSLLKNFEVF